MHVAKEQLCATEFNPVRHANVAHEPARTCATDSLHHGFLSANALQHGISPDSLRQVLDSGNAFVTTFGYDVGCPELARELLTFLVTTHRDDPLGAHLLG